MRLGTVQICLWSDEREKASIDNRTCVELYKLSWGDLVLIFKRVQQNMEAGEINIPRFPVSETLYAILARLNNQLFHRGGFVHCLESNLPFVVLQKSTQLHLLKFHIRSVDGVITKK